MFYSPRKAATAALVFSSLVIVSQAHATSPYEDRGVDALAGAERVDVSAQAKRAARPLRIVRHKPRPTQIASNYTLRFPLMLGVGY